MQFLFVQYDLIPKKCLEEIKGLKYLEVIQIYTTQTNSQKDIQGTLNSRFVVFSF